MSSKGKLHWLQKEVRLYVSLWENDPTFHLIYHLAKQFPNEFTVSVCRFKSSSMQHDVAFINDCPIESEIDDKAG